MKFRMGLCMGCYRVRLLLWCCVLVKAALLHPCAVVSLSALVSRLAGPSGIKDKWLTGEGRG